MTISELIKELKDAYSFLGDKEVYVRDIFGQYEQAEELIVAEDNEKNTIVKIIT